MIKDPADAFDNRQAQSKAMRFDVWVFEPLEFSEDQFLLLLGYTRAGIADLDFKPPR